MGKIFILIVFGISLILVGCGNNNDSNKAQTNNTASVESKTPQQIKLSGETLGGVQPGMNPNDVNKILGEPFEKKTIDNSNYIQFYEPEIAVYFTTRNNDVLEVWKIGTSYDSSVKTPVKTSKGISVDSSIGKVLDTYGRDGYISGNEGKINYIEYETDDKKFIIRFAIRKGERLTESAGLEYISLRNNDGAVSSKKSAESNKKTMINGIELGMTIDQVVSTIGGCSFQRSLSAFDRGNTYGEPIVILGYEKYNAVVVFAARDGVIVLDVVPMNKFY